MLEKAKIFYRQKPVVSGAIAFTFGSLIMQLAAFDKAAPPKLILPLMLYLALLTLLRPIFAAGIVFLTEALLLKIHLLKLSKSNLSLSAADLLETKQAFAVSNYTTPSILLITLALTGLVIFALLKGRSLRSKYIPFLMFVATLGWLEHSGGEQMKLELNKAYQHMGLRYAIWNFEDNVKDNGILTHLLQTTSMSYFPPKGEHTFYKNFPAPKSKAPLSKADVFLILCESCFTSNDGRFESPLIELKELGFEFTSTISPAFGGATSEAEFEMLTGLPSVNLPGIKYQYYGETFRHGASTLPNTFNKNGYTSVAFHNHGAYFWKRKAVYPRFGFSKSYFIEDMDWSGNGWPPDKVLYQKALTEYHSLASVKDPTFFFLVTVSTHGPYQETDQDGGKGAYLARTGTAVSDFKKFYQDVMAESQRQGRSAVFIIFGDHKPALKMAFYKDNIFDRSFFSSTGATEADFVFGELNTTQKIELGRVPLLIGGSGQYTQSIKRKVLTELSSKPAYCFPGVISRYFDRSNKYFSSLRQLCNQMDLLKMSEPREAQRVFPQELYAELLF